LPHFLQLVFGNSLNMSNPVNAITLVLSLVPVFHFSHFMLN
jgi:hypothetical protein